jgi:hypothetical protein
MTTDSRSPSEPGKPCKNGPAPQPHDPGADCTDSPEGPTAPSLPDPKPCETCCDCPKKPPVGPNCLDKLIDQETQAAAKASRAADFKKDLQTLQDATKKALQDYTNEKYQSLLKRWIKADADIVEFIKKIVCAIDCWWCVIECEICPLIYAVRDMERRVYGMTGARYTTADSLLDQQYWWTREAATRKATLDRVKAVLSAWATPATTIDKVLTDNDNFIKNACLGSNSAPLLYDLFFKVIPLHLAIAPPANVQTTGINSKYVNLCTCDDAGPVDNCCGPNVGVPSLRDRLVGPQPFLIDPAKYVDLVCCLAQHRLIPAQDDWAEADSQLSKVTDQIKRATADIAVKMSSLPADVKARLSTSIDCQNYQPKKATPKPQPEPGCCGDGGAGATPAAAAPTQS